VPITNDDVIDDVTSGL